MWVLKASWLYYYLAVFLVFTWIILQYVENKVEVILKQISVALRDDAAAKWVLNKTVS